MANTMTMVSPRCRAGRLTALLAGSVIAMAAGAGIGPVLAQDDEPELPPVRQDPARPPARVSGEAVLPGREAFDRSRPQITIGRREPRTGGVDEEVAQLVGDDRTLAWECELGERVELVGSNNQVAITGQCLGLNIVGDRNQVQIQVVDDIRIQGDGNDVRWRRGFTRGTPDVLQLRGNNSSGPLAAGADQP